MIQIKFKQNNQELTGELKSEERGYLQIIVGEVEFVITEPQVIERVVVGNILPLSDLKFAVQKIYETMNQGETPSFSKVAEEMQVSIDDIRETLKHHQISSLIQFLTIKKPKVKEVQPPIDEEKVRQEIIRRYWTNEDKRLKVVAKALDYTAEQIKEHLAEALQTDYNHWMNDLRPVMGPHQFYWDGKIMSVSNHAQSRLKERFGIQNFLEEVKKILETAAKVRKSKRLEKLSVNKYGNRAQYYVSFKHDMVLVFSHDETILMTVYSSAESEWVQHEINELVWPKHRKK